MELCLNSPLHGVTRTPLPLLFTPCIPTVRLKYPRGIDIYAFAPVLGKLILPSRQSSPRSAIQNA